MYKPVPAVFPSCVRAVAWMLQRGVTVFVEPEVHAEILVAVQRHLAGGNSSTSASHAGGSGGNGGNGGSRLSALSAAVLGASPLGGGGALSAAAAAAVDAAAQLRTWAEPACGCPPAVPASVAHQLDLVITLGGDGTVLWTSGLFTVGAVPPLVPFAMGSLGFMTVRGVGAGWLGRCAALWPVGCGLWLGRAG